MELYGLVAQQHYIRVFRKLSDDISTMVKSIKEFSSDLQVIAEEYKRAEKINEEESKKLKTNIDWEFSAGVATVIEGDGETVGYSELLLNFVKLEEGFQEIAYNNGKTIGYGFDKYKYPNIKIKYNEDGVSISEAEGERLLRLILNQSKNQIDSFLEDNNLKVDQNTYDALIDLFYNRNSNELTQEVAFAMAMKNDEKVLKLLEDFDYKYALKYIYDGDSEKAQAYIERNPGLATRRKEEYYIYKNGIQ